MRYRRGRETGSHQQTKKDCGSGNCGGGDIGGR